MNEPEQKSRDEALGAGLASAATPMLIESLDQLQAIVDEPVYCDFKLNGKLVRVACRRVSQALDEKVRALRRAAQPPYLADRKDYDYAAPAFLKAKELNERMARSLIVYAGCPAVAAKAPGLVSDADIHKFVGGILTELVIEYLAATITAGGMELVDAVNFPFTPGLEGPAS